MLILVSGGSGSGKSEYAENFAVKLGGNDLFYIATMSADDDESLERIKKHRNMRRGKGFRTAECPTDIKSAASKIKSGSTALLDCMGNLLANEMFKGAGEKSAEYILDGINILNVKLGNLVIVTNDVFCDAESYNGFTEKYIENLGDINQKIAKEADTVIEVVCGIPIFHKGKELPKT